MDLFANQKRALDISVNNDFESGIHFHATGTGKSIIGLELINQYNSKYPNKNILWICEQKTILEEQFNIQTLRNKKYDELIERFNYFNFVTKKSTKMIDILNNTNNTNKENIEKTALLLVINRSYLITNKKYENFRFNIDFIIHDECHSITSKTTRDFYEHINSINPQVKIIGFSATPNNQYFPFTKTLSVYSVYHGVCDDVILPPRICWFNRNTAISQKELLERIKELVKSQPYKKIVVWCGIINECINLCKLWQENLGNDYQYFIDTSKTINLKNVGNYKQFYDIKNNGILFCACKHREGSDIPYLDTCVFVDKVKIRTPQSFLQCVGRVLRRDKENMKKYGLVIDCYAKSSMELCQRMNNYLNHDPSVFPWDYTYTKDKTTNISTHNLLLCKTTPKKYQIMQGELVPDAVYDISEITNRFKREIPDNSIYKERLTNELKMLYSKQLIGYLVQAMDILDITRNIPHVTRGSCGSSLTCYLLGISHVDPIQYNISFARFLNSYRNNLPDIDFDFPYNVRDEVFLKLHLKWTGKVARISNHVFYHEKSALREAIRKAGIRKFISKNDLETEIKKLPLETRKEIEKHKKELLDTFKNYSLHCGGIIFYPDGVPNELKLPFSNSSVLDQVILDKREVADEKNFKIDILSSRALAQIYEVNKYRIPSFDDSQPDEKTISMLCSGDNIGITLAESPLMRKALLKIQPKTINDLAVCLAIIRPAAKDSRYNVENGKINKYKAANNIEHGDKLQNENESSVDFSSMFVFDDDGIHFIAKALKCNDDLAEKYRRGFAKNDKEIISELERKIPNPIKRKKLFDKLRNLRKYSFCKSHAYSYAQLVWKVAYMKAHHPIEFWKATLNHCHSSYRKWVHLFEAHKAGVDIFNDKLMKNDTSLFSKKKKEKMDDLGQYEQMRKFGFWNMQRFPFFNDCYFTSYFVNENKIYRFKGIIASNRVLNIENKRVFNKTKKRHYNITEISQVLYIGVSQNKYIEINSVGLMKKRDNIIGIEGTGKMNEDNTTIITKKFEFF